MTKPQQVSSAVNLQKIWKSHPRHWKCVLFRILGNIVNIQLWGVYVPFTFKEIFAFT